MQACTDPASPQDVDIEVTVSASDSITGGAGETGDETGDPGPPTPVVDGCLFNDEDAEAGNVFGYRYQCQGSVDYEITSNGMEFENLIASYGHGQEGDSYAEPKVMACCPAFVGSTCDTPHTQACVIDAIEQACKSLGPRIINDAKDENAGPREAAAKAANYIAEHQDDCFQAFAHDSGVSSTPFGCDANGNSDPDYTDLVAGASWSFDPPGLVDGVVITITDMETNGFYPTDDDPEYPGDACSSSDFNDHLVFSQLDPGLGPSDYSTLYFGGVDLRGPSVIESGTLASTTTSCSSDCSRVAIVVESPLKARMRYMLARGNAPQTVGHVVVDAFRATLIGDAFAAPAAFGYWEIPPGEAIFALSGQALGNTAIVTVSNATVIKFRAGKTGGWDVDPFQLTYVDEDDDEYDFFLGATRWL